MVFPRRERLGKGLGKAGGLGPTPPDQRRNGLGKAGERLGKRFEEGFLGAHVATGTCGHHMYMETQARDRSAKGPRKVRERSTNIVLG